MVNAEYMGGCNIFGGNAGLCDSRQNKNAVVHEVIDAHLQEQDSLCDSMGCVVACSKKLHCLDDTVMEKCQETVRGNPGCNLNCSDSRHSAIATRTLMFAVSFLGFFAATAGA